VVGYGLLAAAGGLFAGGIYGLNVASQHNAEVQKAIEQKRKEGKVLSGSGRVTNNETKLNDKGQRIHVTSIIEFRDNKGERHTIRSSVERFVSEQIDICYEAQRPDVAWVCADGVTDGTAVGIGAASVLALAAGGACVYGWATQTSRL